MGSRDTTTGSAYEEIVKSCIERASIKNNFSARRQVSVGNKPGGGIHKVDWELEDNLDPDVRGMVSCKFQKVGGSAEEKIAYEVIKLLHTMKVDPRYVHSWIVLGGDGWSPGVRPFVEDELHKWIPDMNTKITIFSTTDQLISAEIKLSSSGS